jgi:hypothetical protein
MHDSADARVGAIDLAVDEPLEDRGAAACIQRVRIRIEFHDVSRRRATAKYRSTHKSASTPDTQFVAFVRTIEQYGLSETN